MLQRWITQIQLEQRFAQESYKWGDHGCKLLQWNLIYNQVCHVVDSGGSRSFELTAFQHHNSCHSKFGPYVTDWYILLVHILIVCSACLIWRLGSFNESYSAFIKLSVFIFTHQYILFNEWIKWLSVSPLQTSYRLKKFKIKTQRALKQLKSTGMQCHAPTCRNNFNYE